MSSSEAQFAADGPIAYLTFNRPQARNAMTWAMYDALADACARVEADDSIRVLVVRARGDAFIAGTDISQFTTFQSGDDGIAYERRMDQLVTHPIFGYRISYRRVVEVQARLLGRRLMGEIESYPAFRTR